MTITDLYKEGRGKRRFSGVTNVSQKKKPTETSVKVEKGKIDESPPKVKKPTKKVPVKVKIVTKRESPRLAAKRKFDEALQEHQAESIVKRVPKVEKVV